MFIYPRPHARTPARLKHYTLKLKCVHARPHARTMPNYKARLLYSLAIVSFLFQGLFTRKIYMMGQWTHTLFPPPRRKSLNVLGYA